MRIQVTGNSEQQQYVLDQLSKFSKGNYEADENGMLSRNPCDNPCENGSIEDDIDRLINSNNLYRIHPHLGPRSIGRASTEEFKTGGGGDIYFDPNVDWNYRSKFGAKSITPAAELAHELLGRAIQLDKGVPHGSPGSQTRKCSNQDAVDSANRAYKRMGMDPRVVY